jgi:hypothetical protein
LITCTLNISCHVLCHHYITGELQKEGQALKSVLSPSVPSAMLIKCF